MIFLLLLLFLLLLNIVYFLVCSGQIFFQNPKRSEIAMANSNRNKIAEFSQIEGGDH